MEDQSLQEPREAKFRAYEDRELADLEIECKTKTFKVHGSVIREKSEYFSAAFFGGYKESSTKRITLEDDAFLVVRMIRCMYDIDYPDRKIMARPEEIDPHAVLVGSSADDHQSPNDQIMASSDEIGTEESWISRVNTNVEMYALADKYRLTWLKDMAQTKVQSACDVAYKHLGQLIERDYLSPDYSGVNLGTRIENELLEEIPLVYESTPPTDRGMRNVMIGYVEKNWVRLSKRDKLVDVFSEAPRFGIEMVSAMNPTPLYKGTCRRCKTGKKWLAERVRCICGESETVIGSG